MTDAINPDHYKRLPAEAIEIIEAAIEGAESVPGFLQGQALKYLLRLNRKGCKTTDAKKAKWYLDRLVDLLDEREKQKAADLQSLKDHPFGKLKSLLEAEAPMATQEVTQEVTPEVNPPDGWRFLERGEVIRKGDRYFDERQWKDRTWAIEETYSPHHQSTIRRNRFNVGEKVVHGSRNSQSISVVASILDNDWVDVVCDGDLTSYHVKDLAPYIEDAK